MMGFRFSVDMNAGLASKLTSLSEESGETLGQVMCSGISLLSASLDALDDGMRVGAWRKDESGVVVDQVEFCLQKE